MHRFLRTTADGLRRIARAMTDAGADALRGMPDLARALTDVVTELARSVTDTAERAFAPADPFGRRRRRFVRGYRRRIGSLLRRGRQRHRQQQGGGAHQAITRRVVGLSFGQLLRWHSP